MKHRIDQIQKRIVDLEQTAKAQRRAAFRSWASGLSDDDLDFLIYVQEVTGNLVHLHNLSDGERARLDAIAETLPGDAVA